LVREIIVTDMKKATGILTLLIVLAVTVLAQKNKKQKMNIEKVKIEIWSDVVCPFCFIGKKKMEQAITNLNANDRVEVIWHSFQLAPDFPKDTSLPSTKYLSEKKGYPVKQIKAMYDQLAHQGKEYGIDFQFDNALSFNTLGVHRLIQWAKTVNKSTELKEGFMLAYFTDGIDLSQHENVLKVVEKIGLDTTKAKEILNSDEYMQQVEQDIYQSQQLGIRGVPYFLINEKEVISGAQSDEVFENVLRAALSKIESKETSSQQGICLPNGECK
tara:strand:+ start:3298 stop:4113 length:816 start_codon:yes stop_codon:yes gene_type:complete